MGERNGRTQLLFFVRVFGGSVPSVRFLSVYGGMFGDGLKWGVDQALVAVVLKD